MRIREHGVHVTEVDGAAVVLDVESSKYLTLSETGAHLFGLLTAGDPTLEHLSAALVERYAISEQTAHADCVAFVDALAAEGLLER